MSLLTNEQGLEIEGSSNCVHQYGNNILINAWKDDNYLILIYPYSVIFKSIFYFSGSLSYE